VGRKLIIQGRQAQSSRTHLPPAVCLSLRRNGNRTGRESMWVIDRVMGTGREEGTFL